jgi:TrmH family RNA methyltransferase
VEGEHLVQELEKAAQQNPALKSSELFITEQYQHWPSEFKKTLVNDKQMAHISDTKTPQGIIAVAPCLPRLARLTSVTHERVFYFYEIQDPGNLGTILRSLAWFGNSRCLLSPNSVDPYNPKVVRTSMGAIFHVPLELDIPMGSLKQRFDRIACLDMQGKPLSDAAFQQQDCYVFGNEARGLPHEDLYKLDAQAFTIPGSGAIESLNLASAANLCIYELNR